MMSKLDWQEGFRRIVWIISLAGALFGIGLTVYGGITGIKRSSEINRLKSISERIQKGQDSEFDALPKSDQKQIMAHINTNLKNLDEDQEWKGYFFGGFALAACWFLSFWILFFIARWIVRGFLKNRIADRQR